MYHLVHAEHNPERKTAGSSSRRGASRGNRRQEPARYRRGGRDEPPHADPPLRVPEGLLVDVIRAVEARQRDALSQLVAEGADGPEELADRFWKHLRSPELAPQERLFFEVYGQALQGRQWAKPLLDGIVEDWVGPVAAMLTAAGISPDTARTVARLYIATGRGLLLDVLATGDADEVDTAMQYFSEMLLAHLASARPGASAPVTDGGSPG